ncbi:MAG: hypothetical protein LPK43_03815 [Gammaproteobacteria bacterium]|nr:hypothetical protein [Gammaproteobacteria bacterium]
MTTKQTTERTSNAAAPSEPPYSVSEFAERSKVSRAAIYAAWKEGRGPRSRKIGRRVLIVERPLEWLTRTGEEV